MSQHLAMIDRFRCAIELDHPPNEEEMKLINTVCNSSKVEEGLDILRSAATLLSLDGLHLLTSCTTGLWQDQNRPDIAYAVSIWALQAAKILTDHKAEASVLFMQVRLLLAIHRPNKALEAIEYGKLLCTKHPDLTDFIDRFAEVERTARQLIARSSLPTASLCDICGQSFRIYDGGIHLVLSYKHSDFAQAAHCFSCSLVVCFCCAAWQDSPNTPDVGELSKDIKMPCCPFCLSPLGDPSTSSRQILFPLKVSTDPLSILDIMTQLRSLLPNEDLEFINAVLAADNVKASLQVLRALLPRMQHGFDERLQNGIGVLSNSGHPQLADILLAVLHAIEWVSDKQDKPRPSTVLYTERHNLKEAVTQEVIEQQLHRANLLLEQSDLSRALSEVERVRNACIEIKDNHRLARSFLIRGLIYQKAFKLEQALRSFEQCLTIAQNIGDDLVAAKAHGNLAGCYLSDISDEQRALNHSQEALELYRRVNDEIGVAHTLNNIGGIYLNREDPATALPYLDEAFILKKRHEDWLGAANTIGNIAIAQRILGNLDIALSLTKEAVELARIDGSPLDLIGHLHNLATIAVEANSIQLAIDRYEEGLGFLEKIRSQISDKYLRDNLMKTYRYSFHSLAELYMAQQNYGKALEVLERIAAVGLCEFMMHPSFMRMSTAHPAGDFIAEFPLQPLNEEDIWSTVHDIVPTAIVRYAFVKDALYAFMALPNHTVGDWTLCSFLDFGYDALGEWFIQPPTSRGPSGGWLGPLHDFRGAIKGDVYQLEMPKSAFEQFLLESLIDAWEPRLFEIGSKLFAPLVDHIRESGAESILFIPIGVLSQIPLHSMRWKEGDQEKCIIDEFDVYYAPSLRVYSQADRRLTLLNENILIIADSGSDSPSACTEGRALAALLPSCKLLEGSTATFSQISKVVSFVQ
ncbi:MAG: hypothetical protein NVSMB27_14260 [Ktedonobacteraceae bacterium]